MEFEFIMASGINLLINLSYSVVAIITSVYVLFWVDSRLLKEIDIPQELLKGNVAVAIFASSILMFVALLMAFGFRG